MRWYATGAVALIALVAGCKTNISTEIKLTELEGTTSKMLAGGLAVEVAGCNNYEDSRKPSSSLLEAQEVIPAVFPDAKYIECYTQKMDSFARFELPVALDVDKDGKLFSTEHVNFRAHDGALLTVAIPTQVKDRINAATKGKIGATRLALNFQIRVVNDSSQALPFTAYSVFIDGEPYVADNLSLPPNGSMIVTLSDVSVQAATKTGETLVLVKR